MNLNSPSLCGYLPIEHDLETITIMSDVGILSGMENPQRLKLLGIVDQFRELGLSEDLSLPQVNQIILRAGFR